ncbi:thioredoxin-like protein [Podospora appendiculata]|uniref:Thioredoxin-like protein n=1 Tax=Podospora appendiculata TaxID=314037 RepID=A0AAE0XIC1_9PEZI|nr:thioredoxin-like protein [Podospora appendiculata]
MPSPRRVRLLFYIVLAGVVTMLFITSRFRQAQERDTRSIQDIYHKTTNAFGRGSGTKDGDAKQKIIVGHDHDADGDIDEDDEIVARAMAERLRQAEQKAKDSANAKAPNKPDHPKQIVGVGSSASGQGSKEKGEAQETAEEHKVEVELEAIFKKSPVIVFSKSYCPFSKRAKGTLLEKYLIVPTPFVVELDQHPLGPQLQARLGEMTHRTTVPNIMINGKSIGGGDDIAELDKNKKLIAAIKAVGGKPIEVSERFVEDV